MCIWAHMGEQTCVTPRGNEGVAPCMCKSEPSYKHANIQGKHKTSSLHGFIDFQLYSHMDDSGSRALHLSMCRLAGEHLPCGVMASPEDRWICACTTQSPITRCSIRHQSAKHLMDCHVPIQGRKGKDTSHTYLAPFGT